MAEFLAKDHQLPLPCHCQADPHNRKGTLLKIWIDADAAPRDVKEMVFRAGKRLNLATVLVANQWLQVPPGNPLVSAVRV